MRTPVSIIVPRRACWLLVLAGCGERADTHDDHEEAAAEGGEEHHDEVEIDAKTAAEIGIRTAPVGPESCATHTKCRDCSRPSKEDMRACVRAIPAPSSQCVSASAMS